ncbi:MAG: SxtJ family membrane protein [Gammaproteobacteria bacterium]
MNHDIPELDKKGLRQFGLVTGSIIVVLFGLLLPWLFDLTYPLWPWYVACALGFWALLAPGTMGGLYRGWMRFGLLLNKITTPVIIGLVYFLAITPTALAMKIFGRDPMHRKLDEKLETYRVPSHVNDKSKMEKPF